MEPLPRNSEVEFEFVNDIFGGAIPRNFIPAVEKGIKDAATRGYLAGYPVVNFRAILYDGSYHDVDSNDLSFQMAGRIAFRKAMEVAKPTLLEPIMHVEISIPDEFAGTIMGDLNSRRGRIQGMDNKAGNTIVKAEVPMAEMLTYGADLTSMTQGRWYPTTTTLPDGEMLVVSGADENAAFVTIPGIWNGSDWRRFTGAALALPYYPAMFLAPSGKVFYAGPTQSTQYLSVADDGKWTPVGNRIVASRDYGSAVMYAPGKILYAGGGDPPTQSAEVIDLNDAAPAWRAVPSMAYARRQMLATILADGKVLVTHGTSGAGFNDVTRPVYYAELWNPASESWTTMAPESVLRVYHSTALLLPDGRVLSSGSGEGAGITYANSQLSAQIFSPPYLFNPDGSLAARPTITSAPSTIAYGQTIDVQTPDAGSVTRGTLIRLSSVTHAFNQSQLIYPLTFTPDAPPSNTLHAPAPASGNLAPPGPYMLFLLNAAGVPSVAKMVTVGP